MFDIRRVEASHEGLRSYAQLFKACFPKAHHLDEKYLQWLYAENPEGRVVGYDAWHGSRLAAHYVCIPARMRLLGVARTGLLSLNTATHPDFQGKGLFTRLAEQVYSSAAMEGFEFVYGVANANSTPGFVRKLGFSQLGQLDAKIGIGPVVRGLSHAKSGTERESSFFREWTDQSLKWRVQNPKNPVTTAKDAAGNLYAFAKTGYPGLLAYAELPADSGLGFSAGRFVCWPRVFIGIRPAWERESFSSLYFNIPKFLRPSPLNLIFKSLVGQDELRDIRNVRISFLDFDAY